VMSEDVVWTGLDTREEVCVGLWVVAVRLGVVFSVA